MLREHLWSSIRSDWNLDNKSKKDSSSSKRSALLPVSELVDGGGATLSEGDDFCFPSGVNYNNKKDRNYTFININNKNN